MPLADSVTPADFEPSRESSNSTWPKRVSFRDAASATTPVPGLISAAGPANWFGWPGVPRTRLRPKPDNTYPLVSLRRAKNDPAGALEALTGYRTHIPAGL